MSAPLRPVPLGQTRAGGGFWGPRMDAAATTTAPHCLDQLEAVGDVENFRRCAAGAQGGHQGRVYNDSDVYKTLEGVAYALMHRPDPGLESRADALVATIASAQRADGYLNTAYQLGGRGEPFSNLTNDHEIYCAGHLIEGGVAYAQATGKTELLDVARSFADLLCARYGPGAAEGYCGHPEAEHALFRLADATGEARYAALAAHWIRSRGSRFTDREGSRRPPGFDAAYYIDDVPLAEMEDIHGHAVRAAYFLAAGAELARREPEPGLASALARVWANATGRRSFVTGGIGPSHQNEGFTSDYDLPNLAAYQETCASVAMMMWGCRMGLLTGRAEYWDAVETALYNAFLAGVSLAGDRFFYVNPLASDGGHRRQAWFDCACCPPNVLRTLAAVPSYAYAASDEALYVALYIQGEVCATVTGGGLQARVETGYPWSGEVEITVQCGTPVPLRLRKPAWAEGAAVHARGAAVRESDGWFEVVPEKAWDAVGPVRLSLPLHPRRVLAHPAVASCRGRAALARGPLVYCAEGADNPGGLDGAWLPPDARATDSTAPWLGEGAACVECDARQAPPLDWNQELYRASGPSGPAQLRCVPYFAWANREPGTMAVWMPQSPGMPILS